MHPAALIRQHLQQYGIPLPVAIDVTERLLSDPLLTAFVNILVDAGSPLAEVHALLTDAYPVCPPHCECLDCTIERASA